jgi:hypothetical protein
MVFSSAPLGYVLRDALALRQEGRCDAWQITAQNLQVLPEILCKLLQSLKNFQPGWFFAVGLQKFAEPGRRIIGATTCPPEGAVYHVRDGVARKGGYRTEVFRSG